MAIAGITLLLRSVRLTSKFASASDIPVEFIRKNVKLRGRFRRVTENGLEIEHIPITLPVASAWRRAWLQEPRGALQVQLAGVELAEAGRAWLQRELGPAQVLWFQLLGRENSALFCNLLVKKGRFFSVSLNEEILRRGLGRTVLVKGLNHDSELYWTIHRNFLKAELTALKQGQGIWKEESEKESYWEKFKDSWREMWRKDSSLKTLGSDPGSEKESRLGRPGRTCAAWTAGLRGAAFLPRLGELASRVRFGRKR